MATSPFWRLFVSFIATPIAWALVITDCNYALNRITTQETCHCESDECIFDFNLNEINTVHDTSFVTCDHTSSKLDEPHISTQCIINCNAPNSCNDFMVNVFDGDEISITCDGTNSCNLFEANLNEHEDSLFVNESVSNIVCSGPQSCQNLQYHCGMQTECDLECDEPNTCTEAMMDCSIGGYCECFDFCNTTTIITPSPTLSPTVLFTHVPSIQSVLPTTAIPTTAIPTIATTTFFTTTAISSTIETTMQPTGNINADSPETTPLVQTTQFYPMNTIATVETTTTITTTTTVRPNVQSEQSERVLAVKLKSQEVGDGYFHCVFTVLYALYIGFALFHIKLNKFKLCIPCSMPRFHSKRMSVIVAYVLLIITALFGFVFNLYLYESPTIGDALIFCYFMSFSLFFSHTLLAMWLFHSWIYFDFSTVLSKNSLQKIFRIVRSIVFVMIVIMMILHIVQHSESIPVPIAEVTFGFLSLMSSFVLFGWTLISLIKLEMRNKVRLAGQGGHDLERNGCFTLNGLLTKFLWIGLVVSVLWILQCIFTFSHRLWSNSVIDAHDINNKRNDHNITVIVLYFVIDLMALILLLSLYYILANELTNLYEIEPLEKPKRLKIRNHYEQGKTNDEDNEDEQEQEEEDGECTCDDDDDGDYYEDDVEDESQLQYDPNRIQIYHKHFNEHSGIDGDIEDDTETIMMSNLLL